VDGGGARVCGACMCVRQQQQQQQQQQHAAATAAPVPIWRALCAMSYRVRAWFRPALAATPAHTRKPRVLTCAAVVLQCVVRFMGITAAAARTDWWPSCCGAAVAEAHSHPHCLFAWLFAAVALLSASSACVSLCAAPLSLSCSIYLCVLPASWRQPP
jgi:hypothetical protein